MIYQNDRIELFSEMMPNSGQVLPPNPYEREYHQSYLRVAEANAKVSFAEEKRLETYGKKLALKEAYEERKRCITEVIEEADDGTLIVKTKNLSVASQPRSISNMRCPEIVVFRRLESQSETKCYLFRCQVDMRQIEIYLSEKKLLKGEYLLHKFTNAGVYFEIAKQSKLRMLLIHFFSKMISQCREEIFLPEKPGWHLINEGQYKFFEEGDLTWDKLEKMM